MPPPVPGAVPRPPFDPPPVFAPPPPAAGFGVEEVEPPTEPVDAAVVHLPRPSRPVVRRRRSHNGPAYAALAVLMLAAGGLGYAVLGRDGIERLMRGEEWRVQPASRRVAVVEPATRAEPPAIKIPQAAKPPAVKPPAMPPVAEPRVAAQAPVPPSAPPPAPPEPAPERLDAAATQALERHLERAFEGIRSGDFQRASADLHRAEAVAADDAEAGERVSRWRLLHDYARDFPRHRDDALKAAAAGREYEVEGGKIGVVEIDDDWFVYRGRGRNVRVPRSDIPEAILVAIVRSWFAGANNAGNHMLLGTYHAIRARPDLGGARAEWNKAIARGEPTGRMLLDLLDDPVFTAAAGR